MSDRSDRAQRELKETEAAFEAVKSALTVQLLATKISESVLRDKLVLTIQALDQVRGTLLAVAQDGEIERHIESLREAMTTPA